MSKSGSEKSQSNHSSLNSSTATPVNESDQELDISSSKRSAPTSLSNSSSASHLQTYNQIFAALSSSSSSPTTPSSSSSSSSSSFSSSSSLSSTFSTPSFSSQFVDFPAPDLRQRELIFDSLHKIVTVQPQQLIKPVGRHHKTQSATAAALAASTSSIQWNKENSVVPHSNSLNFSGSGVGATNSTGLNGGGGPVEPSRGTYVWSWGAGNHFIPNTSHSVKKSNWIRRGFE